jgi:hypothetical protein
MDEIRLEVPKEAFEIHHKRGKFAPRKWFASTLPMHLCHTFGNRAVFDLSSVALKLDKERPMPAAGDGFEETVIVRGVTEGEVKDFHMQL